MYTEKIKRDQRMIDLAYVSLCYAWWRESFIDQYFSRESRQFFYCLISLSD